MAPDRLRHFWLFLWNRWSEFNKTWQVARSQRPLQSLCFSGRSEKTWWPPLLWLAEKFWTSPLNRWMEFNETWEEARSLRPLPSWCFSGRLAKQNGLPGLWLTETFSTSHLTRLNGIQRNFTGSKQILNIIYQVCVFDSDEFTKMATLADLSKRLHIVLMFTIRSPLGLLLNLCPFDYTAIAVLMEGLSARNSGNHTSVVSVTPTAVLSRSAIVGLSIFWWCFMLSRSFF